MKTFLKIRVVLQKLKYITLLSLAFATSACQQMGTTEVGVRYRNLPSNLGPLDFGGVASDTVAPGQLAILFPWDRLLTFDTAVKEISWPSTQRPEDKDRFEGFVHTRALDGNEVALAITVRYRILPDAETLTRIVRQVALNDAEVRDLVASVARADIRSFFNELRTAAFLDEVSRYGARDKVEKSMSKRLSQYGIEIQRVILDDFRFERLLNDGTVDQRYQDRITDVQKLREDTERERSRIETVKAKKSQELNNVQALVNREVAEAEGYRSQSKLRGDGYFDSKANEAQGILALGKAEVEGMIQQVEALSGPGARALLKLELAREIVKARPNFVVLNQSNSSGALNVQRLDTNDLLKQLGVVEAMQPNQIQPSSANPNSALGNPASGNVVNQSQKNSATVSGPATGQSAPN